jgi:hypothetical protein
MQESQYGLEHRSPTEAAITVQRILGRGVVRLKWWQNVSPDEDEDFLRRFFGASRKTVGGVGIACARGPSFVGFVIVVVIVFDPMLRLSAI